MSKRTKRIILAIVLVQVVLIIALLILPQAVLAIPGRYRVALADRYPVVSQITEDMIARVAPVADALPAPVELSERVAITIPTLAPTLVPPPTPTPTPTAIVKDAPVQVATSVVESTPNSTPLPTSTPTPEPLPDDVLLTGIKRIQQSFNNCGPANLTQVLNWHGDVTTQAEAASYLKPNPEDRNVSPWQLSDYVNEFTELKSTVHSGGDMEMIKRFIAAGLPVVIEKGYEPDTTRSQGWFGHYLTVFGYDEELQMFHSMDSYLRVDEVTGRADPYEEIERYWQQFNYTFYVVYEPDQEAQVQSILGQDLLQPMQMWLKAAERAQAELENDPDNAFIWFNLGTSLTRLGELTGSPEYYESGAAAFDQALAIGLPPRMLWYEFRPYLAYMKVGRYEDMITLAEAVLATQGGQNVEETYLYQGHALLFQGDVAAAAAAYKRALQLNQNFYPAEIALQSIS
ncbi:MAG: C39 family peptidase [Chloroflexota bacterium]|nr:MAG: C39 family peptidase [Chloroflexota bacterium]